MSSEEKSMRKRVIGSIFICITILLAFSLIGCNKASKKVPGDEVFQKTIDEKIYNIVYTQNSMVAISSNPYDYIKDKESLEDYKYIVSQGEKALNYMLHKFSISSSNGLEEYIMAIACSEILEEDRSLIKWASGQEWYSHYMKENNP
jgi:hypothetical protein